MAEVVDLDVQVPVASAEGKPSANFESRWHDLVLKIKELEAVNADQEARITVLENP